MEAPTRPYLIIDTNLPPFEPPPDTHPILAQTNIKDWSYQHFVLQIILREIFVISVNDIEREWIDSLKSLNKRKEIDKHYRSFIKKLIDYQVL